MISKENNSYKRACWIRPSPVTQCYRMKSPGSAVAPAHLVGLCRSETEIWDLFEGPPRRLCCWPHPGGRWVLDRYTCTRDPSNTSLSSWEGVRCVAGHLICPSLGTGVPPVASPCFGQPPGLSEAPSITLPPTSSAGLSVQSGTEENVNP